jgi:hypothetical protein
MLDLKLKPKQKVPADRAGRQAQRRGHLPSQLSEVVLFDGINGTTQLDIVKSWVLDNIDENREDLEALAGTPPAGRVALCLHPPIPSTHRTTSNWPTRSPRC